MTQTAQSLQADHDITFHEVAQLHTYRLIWKNLLALLQSRPDLPHDALVNNWLVTSYTRTLAVGIRRQCETRGNRATIGSVLRHVQENPQLFTRGSCGFPALKHEDRHSDPWIHAYADAPDEHLDPSRASTVATELSAAQEAASRWVNKKVAHLDPNAPEEGITFEDLEQGMSGLRDALKFLFPLFNQGSILWNVTPSTPRSWLHMFSQPWYVKDSDFAIIDAFDLG
jgi:hypothetical protein